VRGVSERELMAPPTEEAVGVGPALQPAVMEEVREVREVKEGGNVMDVDKIITEARAHIDSYRTFLMESSGVDVSRHRMKFEE
ncbi:hypothetical protein HK104_010127, partial [Borealophlyctis nickersoniae]